MKKFLVALLMLPLIPLTYGAATAQNAPQGDVAKGKAAASCPFEYAARLTEIMLLGVVSLRAGTKIHYDADNMRVTNALGANDYLTRQYRAGW